MPDRVLAVRAPIGSYVFKRLPVTAVTFLDGLPGRACFCSFAEASTALGVAEPNVALLVGRKMLTPATSQTGEQGVTRSSVRAEADRRSQRGVLGRVWDGIKTVYRWMP